METITVKELADAVQGKLLCGDADTEIGTLSFDSRKIAEKTLYVPLSGERVDGHQFIENALQAGAVATLTEQDIWGDGEKPYIQVRDAKAVLQKAAALLRAKKRLPIIGITGSVGKTTTRSMVAEALSAKKRVFQTRGNLNSQLGVPLMLADIAGEEIAVLEMGMSEFGEMERLTRMVQPDMAIITCIGVAHINQLGSQRNICHEKLAITNGMKPEALLVLNGDDSYLRGAGEIVRNPILYYGTTPDCAFYAKDIRIVKGKAEFLAVCQGEAVEVTLSMPGKHNVLNALAALAACKLNGVNLQKAAEKLAFFGGIKMRQQIYRTKKYTVIDDTYNANPDSMKAGIQVLMEYPQEGRKVAVLGDMLELGKDEILFHKEVGAFAAETGVDLLLTVGSLARYMEEAALEKKTGIQVNHVEKNSQITAYLEELLEPEDVVLLKGSRGMALNEVVDALLQYAGYEQEGQEP